MRESQSERMLTHVRDTIKKHRLLESGDRVLIGVSGGKDSVTLLDILTQLKSEYDLTLGVAHFDHQLRKNAKKDATFVHQLAARYGFPYFLGSADVRLRAKREKRSIEDAARQARYQFFAGIGEEFRATKLALGHTLDDQVETFFLRLLRGAGLLGLRGIPIKRKLESRVTLIRPLLYNTSAQICDYLKEQELPYREDVTNQDTIYARNKIRHELLPWLKQELNPNLIETISRTQQLILQTNEYLDSLVNQHFAKLKLRQEKQLISLDNKKFLRLNRLIQSLILRRAISLLNSQSQEIGFDHIDAIVDKIAEKILFRVQLPNNLWVESKTNSLIIRQSHTKIAARSQRKYKLTVPGITRLTALGYELSCSLVERAQLNKSINSDKHSKLAELVDFDKIRGTLHVRTRRPGDWFVPLGLKGRKKLQDFFVDQKISHEKRDRVPLVCDDESIIWVVGHRLSDAYRVDNQTKTGLKLTARMLKEEDE